MDAQTICDRFGPLVWRCVYRILGNYAEAQDCCQDVLCEVLHRDGQYDLRDESIRWLATRRAIDRLRKRKRAQSRLQPEADVLDLAQHQPGPLAAAEFHELLDRLRHELAKLPQPQAEAFWMKCIEEMTYSEIADQLGVDANAVGVLIHRAKSRLRESLSSAAGPRAKE